MNQARALAVRRLITESKDKGEELKALIIALDYMTELEKQIEDLERINYIRKGLEIEKEQELI